jgi:Uma2 family endonuclease
MDLLIELVCWFYRDRTDFYAGGNMFIYFTEKQAQGLRFRGPDFFYVNGVPREPIRRKWVVMHEGGKYPDVIIELLSETTANEDRTTKKHVYETVFHTHEYFCYDPETKKLEGWRLIDGRYEDIVPNERGWLWSSELNLWLGAWEGKHPGTGAQAVWLRYFDAKGELVLNRAEAAEAEIARLKAILEQKLPDQITCRRSVERAEHSGSLCLSCALRFASDSPPASAAH